MPKILYSPGFGAGWSTWSHSDNPLVTQFFLAHPGLLDAVERGLDLGSKDEPGTPLHGFVQDFERLFPEEDSPGYLGGARDLTVAEIPAGQPFRIEEYDGHESVVYFHPEDYFVMNEQPRFEIEGEQRELPQGK